MTMKSLSLRFHTMLAAIVRQQQKMTRHWLRPLFTTIGPTLMNSKKHLSWETTNGSNRLVRPQFEAVSKNKVFRRLWTWFWKLIFSELSGIKRRVAAQKELLTDIHRQRRLQYSEQLSDWNLINWSRVISIDEFGISSDERGKVYVWRLNGTRFDEQNIALRSRTRRFRVSFIAW